jgi:methyltransferase (TIGR00027 family)
MRRTLGVWWSTGVRDGQASVTAQSVALARGQLHRTATPEGDANADERLSASIVSRSGPIHPARPGLVAYIAARTQFFDEELLAAMAGGVGQVVIAGAGYDGRAMRFRASGVRFFEVDHPATQSDKRQRLLSLGISQDGITFVPADFMVDDIPAQLAAAGHERDAPTFFMCEGVLRYLPDPVIETVFTSLRTCAGAGSRFAVSVAGRVVGTAQQRRLTAIGEPARSTLTTEDALALLATTGWTPERVVDFADLAAGVEPGRATLIRSSAAIG